MMMLVPDENSGILILANLNVTALPEAIRALYVERILGNEKLAALLTPTAPPMQPGPFVAIFYGRCEIATDGPGLRMSCSPAHRIPPLCHLDNRRFFRHRADATNGLDAITFSIGAAGNADSFTDESLGRFTRIEGPHRFGFAGILEKLRRSRRDAASSPYRNAG